MIENTFISIFPLKMDYQHPINRDVWRWYPLTESGPSARNLGNASAVGTIPAFNGAPAPYVTRVEAEFGYCFKFSGGNQSGRFSPGDSTGVIENSDTFGYSVWIKHDGNTAGDIRGKLLSGSNGGQFDTFLTKSGERVNFYAAGANDQSAVGTVPQDEWVHLFFRYDPVNGRQCIKNGKELIINGSHNGTIGSISNVTFGNLSSGNNRPYSGLASNLRIFNRVVSDYEIWQLCKDPWVGLKRPSSTRYFLPLSVPRIRLTLVKDARISLKGANGKVALRSNA